MQLCARYEEAQEETGWKLVHGGGGTSRIQLTHMA
jgi:hypothetical protein